MNFLADPLRTVGTSISSLFTGKRAYRIFNMENPTSVLIEGLKIKSINPTYRAEIAQHPTEDGSVIQDNKIILPTEVQVEGFCTDLSAFSQLQSLLNDRTNLFGVQVKEILLENMAFRDMTPVRDGQVLSAIPVSFSLVQIVTAVAESGISAKDAKDPTNTDTIANGEMNGADPPPDEANRILVTVKPNS